MVNPILTKTIKICTIILGCLLGYLFLTYTFPILIPISIAVLIALFIEPFVAFLENKLKFPRVFASITILVIIIIFSLGIFMVMLTEIYEGIAYLAERLPEQLQNFGYIMEHYFHTIILPFYQSILSLLADTNQLMIQENLSELFTYVAGMLGTFFENLLFSIPRIFAIVPESLTILLFVFLASLLLSADLPRVKEIFSQYIPKGAHEKLTKVFDYLKKTATGFVRAQIILVTISFFLIFIGLLILNVEHALTISLFMIVIDFVPFVGTGLFFIPWIIYLFLTANYSLTIGLALLYMVVIIVRQLIEPKVLSMNIGIHPLTWLIAVFIGLKTWGVLGLLLAPFVIIILKGLHHAGIFRWLIKWIKGSDPPIH